MELEYPFTITKKNTDAILKDISQKLKDTGYRYHFYLTEHKESCMLEVKFLEYGGISENNVPEKKFPIDKSSLGGKVLLTGEFKQCTVAGTHPKWQKFWRKQDLKHFLGVPLKIEGVVYGVLAVAKQEDIEFNDDAIENVQRLAAILAVAMQTSQFIDTLRDMFDRNQALMLGFTHEEALLNEICKNCREISQADKAFIFLVEQEDEQQQEYANNITVKKGLQKLQEKIDPRNKICANDIFADTNIRLTLTDSAFCELQIKRAIEILRLIYVAKDSTKDFYTLNLKDVLKRLLGENSALTIKVKDGTKPEKKINIAGFLFSDFALLSVKGCADGLVDGAVIVKDVTNKEEYMYPYLILVKEDFSSPSIKIYKEGLTAYIARTRQQLSQERISVTNDYSVAHKNKHYDARNRPCQSVLAFPLLIKDEKKQNQDRIIGVLKVEDRIRCYLDEEPTVDLFYGHHKEIIGITAEFVNAFINNYKSKVKFDERLQNSTKQIVKRLAGMSEETLYDAIVRSVSDIFKFPMCTLYLIDKNSDQGFKKNVILKEETFKYIYQGESGGDIVKSYDIFKKIYKGNLSRFSDKVFLLKIAACYGYTDKEILRTYIIDTDANKAYIQGEGIAAYIARQRKSVILRNRGSFERHPSWSGHLKGYKKGMYEDYDYKDKKSCSTSIGVPLKAGEEILGVLKIESYEKDRILTDQDKLTLEILADAVTIAIKNAKTKGRKYGELFGLEIFDRLNNLSQTIQKGKGYLAGLNKNVFEHLTAFHIKVSGESPAIYGEEEIEKGITETIKKLCSTFGLSNNFVEISREFKRQEGVLYSIEFYRDHYFHQFHTFLLGYIIINLYGMETIDQIYRRQCVDYDRGSVKANDNNILRAWFIASILHDMAYPVEKIDKWLDAFLKIMFYSRSKPKDTKKFLSYIDLGQGLDDIHHYILNRLEGMLIKRLEVEDSKKPAIIGAFRNAFHNSKEHALFGAVMLLTIEETALREPLFWEAALAIALHHTFRGALNNMEEFFEFEKFPLPFLLAYCDLVQEWGRLPEIGSDGYSVDEMQSKRLFKIERNKNIITSAIVYNLENYYRAVSNRPGFEERINSPEFKKLFKDFPEASRQRAESAVALNLISEDYHNFVEGVPKKWVSNKIHFHLNYYYRDTAQSEPLLHDKLSICFCGKNDCSKKSAPMNSSPLSIVKGRLITQKGKVSNSECSRARRAVVKVSRKKVDK